MMNKEDWMELRRSVDAKRKRLQQELKAEVKEIGPSSREVASRVAKQLEEIDDLLESGWDKLSSSAADKLERVQHWLRRN